MTSSVSSNKLRLTFLSLQFVQNIVNHIFHHWLPMFRSLRQHFRPLSSLSKLMFSLFFILHLIDLILFDASLSFFCLLHGFLKHVRAFLAGLFGCIRRILHSPLSTRSFAWFITFLLHDLLIRPQCFGRRDPLLFFAFAEFIERLFDTLAVGKIVQSDDCRPALLLGFFCF